jgi:hypothetical protein
VNEAVALHCTYIVPNSSLLTAHIAPSKVFTIRSHYNAMLPGGENAPVSSHMGSALMSITDSQALQCYTVLGNVFSLTHYRGQHDLFSNSCNVDPNHCIDAIQVYISAQGLYMSV